MTDAVRLDPADERDLQALSDALYAVIGIEVDIEALADALRLVGRAVKEVRA